MTDEPIFICDPPPGTRYVITTNKVLSREAGERLCASILAWLRDPNGVAIILEDGLRIDTLPGGYKWPDAEFHAA